MTETDTKKLFWLHIKKSAGQSTRAILSPYYKTVDRCQSPKCFIQADPSEYNDILNNYRIPLGCYQFRRALFAKKYLYGADWDGMVKFAFSREPISRCVSAFYQFFGGSSKVARTNRRKFICRHYRLPLTTASRFDAFLDMIAESRAAATACGPYDLHFSTHTATMWDDVTDEDGTILLDCIFRLEDFRAGINHIFRKCNLPPADDARFTHKNRGKHPDYRPDAAQIRKIKALYAKDFDIYERCTKPVGF